MPSVGQGKLKLKLIKAALPLTQYLPKRNLYQDVVGRYVQGVTLRTRSMHEDTYRLRALIIHIIAK